MGCGERWTFPGDFGTGREGGGVDRAKVWSCLLGRLQSIYPPVYLTIRHVAIRAAHRASSNDGKLGDNWPRKNVGRIVTRKHASLYF